MFKNIPNWAIIFYIGGYVLTIPFGFLLFFYYRVRKEIGKGYLMAALMYLIPLATIAVLVFSLPSEFLEKSLLRIFTLLVLISTSPLVGGGIYFIWHGMTRKGMDKKEHK